MSGPAPRPKAARLGRGLGALLGDSWEETQGGGTLRRVRPSQISPNPWQPRREFTEEELGELRESIRVNGLLQPPVVRPAPEGSRTPWELVAGERRFRCVRQLGWEEIPVLVRDVEDRTLLVLALVENIQRENLGPLEEAEGYRVLQEEFGLTQAEIADEVGKSRPAVANALRLLRLPPSLQRRLQSGELSMGHARALLAVEDPGRQLELARRAVAEGWSVREVERRAGATPVSPEDPAQAQTSDEGPGPTSRPRSETLAIRALQEEMERTLGTRASIRGGRSGSGVIEITFRSHEDFERLFQIITGLEVGDVTG